MYTGNPAQVNDDPYPGHDPNNIHQIRMSKKGGTEMARLEETVVINRPSDKVFAYVADPNTWPKWNLDMLEAQQTSPGQAGVGATFRGANKIMGRRMPWDSKVTNFVQNKGWGATISSGSTLIHEDLTFDSLGQGTKFTWVYDMKVSGFLKLFAPMVISSTHKGMKTNISTLKTILEAQA